MVRQIARAREGFLYCQAGGSAAIRASHVQESKKRLLLRVLLREPHR